MKARDVAVAVTGLAMISWVLRPRTDTAELLGIIGRSHVGMIRAATGPGTPEERRSAADVFAQQADEALARLWEGFESW